MDTKWARGFEDEIDLVRSVERAVQFKSGARRGGLHLVIEETCVFKSC